MRRRARWWIGSCTSQARHRQGINRLSILSDARMLGSGFGSKSSGWNTAPASYSPKYQGDMKHTMINAAIERAVGILTYDPGCAGMTEYVEHLSWLFFLKFIDQRTNVSNTEGQRSGGWYEDGFSDEYRWSAWVPKMLNAGSAARQHEAHPAADQSLSFIRERLFPYLASLSGGPELEKLSQIFKGRTPPTCGSPDNLRKILGIVDCLGDPDSTDDSFISAVYANLLSRLRPSGKVATGYYTPDAVVNFMVAALAPKVGETVYDPACGAGNLLVAAYERLKAEVTRPAGEVLIQRDIAGREIESLQLRLCYMQMLLKGMGNSAISCYDPSKPSEDGAAQFDIILTNPPFGKNKPPPPPERGMEQPGQPEDRALEYAMSKLRRREGARCGVIVSEGFLFRGGRTAATRRRLLDEYNLFMLVKLPAGVFGPHSSVSTSILFFEWPGPTKEVLYYKLSPQAGRRAGKNELTFEKHFSRILAALQTWNRHRREGGAPPGQTTATWVEPIARIEGRGHSLMAHPPADAPHELQFNPAELLLSLLERTRKLNSILGRLHASVTDKEGR